MNLSPSTSGCLAETLSAELAGKVCLITGGHHAIGRAVTLALAQRGASVAFTYEGGAEPADTFCRELLDRGAACRAFQADLAAEGETHQIVKEALAEFGLIDILVNHGCGTPADNDGMGVPTCAAVSDAHLNSFFNITQ